MENIRGFQSLIQSTKNTVIITHFKPDADALGSSLGLANFLKRKGHRITVCTPSDYPAFLSWMPGNDERGAMSVESKAPEKKAHEAIANADVIFCIDFSNLKRIESLEESVRSARGEKILIDHHLEPEKFAVYEQWDPHAASTAGLVFQLIDQMGEKHRIDSDIATCLSAGVMTDPGGFRHSNTTQVEFLIASELTGLGANPSDVAKQIYDNNTLERLKLTGFVLSQKLQVFP